MSCLSGERITLYSRKNFSPVAPATGAIDLQGPPSLVLCGFLLAFGDPSVAWLGMEEVLESRFVRMGRQAGEAGV